MTAGSRRPGLFVLLALFAMAATADPRPLIGQEEPQPADSAVAPDTVPGEPVTPDEAQAIRDTLQRPPAQYSADWVDVVEFPLKVIGWPLDLVLVRFPGWLAGKLTAPRPPSGIVRTYRAMSAWGLRPTIRSTIGPRSAAALELQFDRYYPFYVHAAVSRRLSQRYRTGFILNRGDYWLTSEAKWQRDAQTPFYGIGSGSRADDRSFYRRDWWDVVARTGLRATQSLIFAGGVAYEHNEVSDPIGTSNSIFGNFPIDSLYGSAETTEYLRLELSGTLDLTRWRDFQQSGVTAGVAARSFFGLTGTDSDFRLLTGFLQTYVPLNEQQQLALRVITDISRDDGGEGVPFYHLSRLGGSRSALGFPSARFVDYDMLSFMSEYRFEVWRELHSRLRAETFLFFHYGAVGETLGSIEGGDWKPSYGLGMRFSRPTALLGLAYLGFGSEGVTAGIRGSWPF
ncbi:MAG: outer membrane protein assembly factor [marine benthic group bacterium]|nr:outer membrane protein assembly factor [Candidatus Benthicola marisminoris]